MEKRWQSLGRYPHSLGDYSIDGFEGRVHVERKSLQDVQATVLGWDSEYQRREDLPGRRECGQGLALSAPTLAQAADVTLRAGTTRDWKHEFISHHLLAGACAFLVYLCFLS